MSKELISYEEFLKLDLRVATVLTAEAVKKTDRLVKLELDAGDLGNRIIVAGIRGSYTVEGLVGRKVVYLANLAPRKLRGVLSNGMLLAVHDDEGNPVLLQPENSANVTAGNEVG